MDHNQTPIPFQITRLLVGYFLHTLTDKELDEMEDWMNSDEDNQLLFEECLEMALRPKQFNPVMNEDDIDLRHIVDLFMKHINKSISPVEKETLDNFLKFSEKGRHLFNRLPNTNDAEEIYKWLLLEWSRISGNPGLN